AITGMKELPIPGDHRPERLIREPVRLRHLPIGIIRIGEGQPMPPGKRLARLLLVEEANAGEGDSASLPPLVRTLPPGGVGVADGSPGSPKQQNDGRAFEV